MDKKEIPPHHPPLTMDVFDINASIKVDPCQLKRPLVLLLLCWNGQFNWRRKNTIVARNRFMATRLKPIYHSFQRIHDVNF